jgi:hypothetical protein
MGFAKAENELVEGFIALAAVERPRLLHFIHPEFTTLVQR